MDKLESILLKKFVCVADFETEALIKLPKSIRDYYLSGSDDEQTLKRNIEALKKYVIYPRVLCDVSVIDTSCNVRLYCSLNSKKPSKNFEDIFLYPIIIAPTAFHCMAHPNGEIATIKSASKTNTLMIASTLSTVSLEDIALNALPTANYWYQLYIYKDKQITKELINRAINAGYKALVLTVDAPLMGRRRADERNGFELPSHLKLANFNENLFSKTKKGVVGTSGFAKYSSSLFDMTLQWSDLEWLISISSIPVIIKGIMRADDAERAILCGVSGIIVSNHGGRQLDNCASTIEALTKVVKTIRKRCPIFVDGGFRTGTDIFKAIALGADSVLIGRPIIYGLAVAGAEGVKKVIELLRIEFDYALRLSGCANINQIQNVSNIVINEKYFQSKI